MITTFLDIYFCDIRIIVKALKYLQGQDNAGHKIAFQLAYVCDHYDLIAALHDWLALLKDIRQ